MAAPVKLTGAARASPVVSAVEYYNAVAVDLGYWFANMVAEYFDRITELPTASAVRWKNVRRKPMKRFRFLIANAGEIDHLAPIYVDQVTPIQNDHPVPAQIEYLRDGIWVHASGPSISKFPGN